jgi:hypothetical protein
VHHVYYTPELEEARSRGDLKNNSFVRLRKLFVNGEPTMTIDDLGDSEGILRNRSHLKQTAQALIKRGIIPDENGWGGWLGRYQTALHRTALEVLGRGSRSDDSHVSRARGRSQDR